MYSIGCDPETFLKDSTGKVISAIGKIGGTKKRPAVVEDLCERYYVKEEHGLFAVQEDNVTLEYNIPAAWDRGQFVDYLDSIHYHIDSVLKPMGLKRHIVPSVVMPEDQLQEPAAWIFGCEPDYNAWTRKINPRPHSMEPKLRSAGGHIHVGYEGPNKISSIELIKILDLFIGIPMMVAEEPNRRAELYGKAGAMRFKPFGVEYRTPSNFWTAKRSRIEWVCCQVKEAVVNLRNGAAPWIDPEVPTVLNAGDKTGGLILMEKYGVNACPA